MTSHFVNFTSQTSATDSMLRIFCRLLDVDFNQTKEFVGSFYNAGKLDDLVHAEFPKNYKLFQFNVPPKLNKNTKLNEFKYLVNFRDPRDRICNKYHWSLIHPTPGLSDSERRSRIEAIKDKGIDKWVLQNLDSDYFDNFWYLMSNISTDSYKVLSYARLCLDFDSFLIKSADFLEIELTQAHWDSLANERVENLKDNDSWIGNSWQGSDILPGRYKSELRDETVARLNEHYKDTLINMANFDPDFKHLYLEGLK